MIYREYTCAFCGSAFMRYPMNQTRASRPQYCSRECSGKAQSKKANENLFARAISRISIAGDDECWEWQGRTDTNGYGRIDYKLPGEHRSRPHLAHRLAYEFFVGEIPDGKHVLHKCDNPPCCNPSHHFLGTQADNNRDREMKGRGRPPMLKGEEIGTSKLTSEQVLEIIRSDEPGPKLAAYFGVTKDAINAIRRGITWSHLTGVRR